MSSLSSWPLSSPPWAPFLLMALSHSVPSAPVLVTENSDDGWQMTGSSREPPPPVTPHYMHILKQGWGIWENTSPTRRRGSYLSEKRARKADGEQMRKRDIYVVTNHCERGSSCLSRQQQHRNKAVPQTFLANHGKSKFPQTLRELNQNRAVFSKQRKDTTTAFPTSLPTYWAPFIRILCT